MAEQFPAFAAHGIDRHTPDVLEDPHVRAKIAYLVPLEPLAGEVVDEAVRPGVLQQPFYLH